MPVQVEFQPFRCVLHRRREVRAGGCGVELEVEIGELAGDQDGEAGSPVCEAGLECGCGTGE